MNSRGQAAEKKQGRIVYFDFLRVIATFAVVVLHVSVQNYYAVEVKTWEWQTFNFYDSIVRWSVPIFVMISGALFLNGDHNIKNIYKKNIARIIVSFVFWSAIYTAVSICVLHYGWKKALEEFFVGHYHMWFLFMIVGLYMIVPLVKTIVSSKRLVEYFLVLSLLFNYLVPQLIAIISLKFPFAGSLAKSMTGYMSFHFALGYAGYFVAGYYLSKIELSKKVKGIIYFLGICGFVVTIIGTSALSLMENKADKMFYGNLTVNVMLESIAVFVFIKEVFSNRVVSDKIETILGVMSQYSFGMYLVHVLILEEIERLFGFQTLSISPVISVPLISIIVFAASFVVSAIFNHIPILKKVV